MPKHYFLGQNAHFSRRERLAHTFAFGLPKDSRKLHEYLANRYQTSPNHVAITKNGRSALAIALQFNLKKAPKSSLTVLLAMRSSKHSKLPA